MSQRNKVQLLCMIDGENVKTNFRLSEFENKDGLVMLHLSVLESLQRLRNHLCEVYDTEVAVIVTNGVRTQADNDNLGARLGFTDAGGKVSRNSKHLARFGGIAVDFKAIMKRDGWLVPQDQLGIYARHFFDWVKDDYGDGHVHADNRDVL